MKKHFFFTRFFSENNQSRGDAEAVEQFILQTLSSIVEKGIAKEEIEASLHQLELSQREIGGDGYPYGLQLILQALTAATHRGDAVELMDFPAISILLLQYP